MTITLLVLALLGIVWVAYACFKMGYYLGRVEQLAANTKGYEILPNDKAFEEWLFEKIRH
jgi:hypothetical protein